MTEIDYELGPEDITAYQKHLFDNSPEQRRAYYMGYVWGILAAAIFLWLLGPVNLWSVLPVVFFLILYLIFYPLSIRSQLSSVGRKLAKRGRNRGLLGKHRMVLKEEGLEDSHTFGGSHILWQGVENVQETRTHIFISTSLSSSYIVPKAAFPDSALAHDFFQAARGYFEKANPVPANPRIG